ncbi:MAG: hypothetical protein ACYDCC_08975 [Actinomycetota bacterium]
MKTMKLARRLCTLAVVSLIVPAVPARANLTDTNMLATFQGTVETAFLGGTTYSFNLALGGRVNAPGFAGGDIYACNGGEIVGCYSDTSLPLRFNALPSQFEITDVHFTFDPVIGLVCVPHECPPVTVTTGTWRLSGMVNDFGDGSNDGFTCSGTSESSGTPIGGLNGLCQLGVGL